MFGNVWAASSASYLTSLRDHSLGHFPTLEDVNWRLHLQTSARAVSKRTEACAIVEMKTKVAEPLELLTLAEREGGDVAAAGISKRRINWVVGAAGRDPAPTRCSFVKLSHRLIPRTLPHAIKVLFPRPAQLSRCNQTDA
jgi:hypothetical protein